MTVKLSIEIISPLTPDDRDLLAGLAVMTVAIANRELAMNGEQQEEPNLCGDFEFLDGPDGKEATGRVCVSDEGHAEAHDYRAPVMPPLGMN